MSLFICADCGSVDNTALTNYWFRRIQNTDGRPLCSACGPNGAWHGRFERKQWDGKTLVLNPPSVGGDAQ